LDLEQEITVIVSEIVNNIDNILIGTETLNTNVVSFCDTKYARKGKTLVDEAENVFKIEFVDYNNSIEAINPDFPFEPNVNYALPKPFFISGTKLAANNEWTQKEKTDLGKKTPLIWLFEIIRQTNYGRNDTRLFSSDLRIFFLDETNIRDFYTEDHRREVVYPMMRLAQSFIDIIQKDRRFQRFEDHEIISFSRFGVEQETGVIQNILDANLSGVELRFPLTMYKNNCKC